MPNAAPEADKAESEKPYRPTVGVRRESEAVRHLLRRHSEGVGISVAAFFHSLLSALAALFHLLLALFLES